MPLTVKSLILDLLSTLRRGSMPVRALVAAGALFGFSENNLRVTLARLCSAGSVERDERGRYRLRGRTDAVRHQILSWRRIEERLQPWDGDWVAVHTGAAPALRGARRRRHLQALRLLGFAPFGRGLELRPDNLRGGIAGVREQLQALGLDPAAGVFGLCDLDPSDQRQATGLWDVNALLDCYAASRRELGASAARLPGLSHEAAMVESFLVGGRVLRRIVLDPLLPEAIAPASERDAMIDAMRDYDRMGRARWADFLARFDVPHLRAPVELHLATAAARLTADGDLELMGGLS